jgi:hypothetical protein
MNKPKVFSMNECDWWMAPTREQAIADYLAMTGLDADECIDDPHELSDESMQTLKYVDDCNDTGEVVKRTFAEELERRIASGVVSEFFASTEY